MILVLVKVDFNNLCYFMTKHYIWVRYLKNSLKFKKTNLYYSNTNISIKSTHLLPSYFFFFNGDSSELSYFFRNKSLFLKKTYLVRYLYKIFLRKGYSYKSLSYISASLTKLNNDFYEKCFFFIYKIT